MHWIVHQDNILTRGVIWGGGGLLPQAQSTLGAAAPRGLGGSRPLNSAEHGANLVWRGAGNEVSLEHWYCSSAQPHHSRLHLAPPTSAGVQPSPTWHFQRPRSPPTYSGGGWGRALMQRGCPGGARPRTPPKQIGVTAGGAGGACAPGAECSRYATDS